jgi:glycosyltransferase involved in cell wall biosynthesis
MFLYSELRNDSRVEREARALVNEGWTLRVIAANDPASRRQAEEAHEWRDGYEIVRVDRSPAPAKLAQRAAPAAVNGHGAAAANGAPGTPSPAREAALLPWRVSHRWLDHRKYVRGAIAEARRTPADLWICHDLSTLAAGAAVRRELGGALLYDSHELWLDRSKVPGEIPPERWRWQRMERALIGRADVTVTVCDSIADTLAERYGIARPAVVRNVPERPADDSRRDLRARAGIENDRPLVLHLGGQQRGRGLETLIGALPALPDCELVLLGSAAPGIAAELAALAGSLGVRDRVHFVPAVPVAEVLGYARSAAVGVAPIQNEGLNHLYSLPNKLFEYLNAGLPVVTSDFPEMARIVAEHDVGETFSAADPDDLARAIGAVLQPGRREQLAANARAAAQELNWERERTRYLAAVDAALAR